MHVKKYFFCSQKNWIRRHNKFNVVKSDGNRETNNTFQINMCTLTSAITNLIFQNKIICLQYLYCVGTIPGTVFVILQLIDFSAVPTGLFCSVNF